MGSVISWIYDAFYGIDRWMNQTWTELVIEEQQHPIILAIAVIIVLSLLLSLCCSICSCCWALCCHKKQYVRYQPIYDNEKHNYAAIPSANHPPYNPTGPSTSKTFMAPVEVHSA